MKKTDAGSGKDEPILLYRGGSVVSTFAGSFGFALKETRLTALLGYLIGLRPEPFLELFGFTGKPSMVTLEHRHEEGRSDILIETSDGIGIVEAKIDATDPLKQSKKYNAKWSVLLTQYHPSNQKKTGHNFKYLNWQKLADLLIKLKKQSQNSKVRFISGDLYDYLEENHMIKQRESLEIYARDINEPISLVLFLDAGLYGCWYKEGSPMPKALYFAPYFGQSIARKYPGIHVGLSHIAKIERVEVVETWQDLMSAIRDIRGKAWLNTHFHAIQPLRSAWSWKGSEKRSFLFLSPPRLAFNPPIRKVNLQKGSGFLSKLYLSFDDLFAAWGK